jgi:hypothetical protein
MLKISDVFDFLFPSDFPRNIEIINCVKHSINVAKAAKIISSRIESLDAERAFILGLIHDIGKIFLNSEEKYKHPLWGYRKLIGIDKEAAEICISHPFPQFDDCSEYVNFFCRYDKKESEYVLEILRGVSCDSIYIKLVQVCDKLASKDGFVSIEKKFDWYKEKYGVSNSFLNSNYLALIGKKAELEFLAKINIYSLLSIKDY